MKKILLFSLLISNYFALGQGYIKLLNDSLYWDVPIAEMGYICDGYGPNGPFRYKISGDTVINDQVYSKIYSAAFVNLNTPPAPNCPPFAVDTVFSLFSNMFLREDTISQKVWRLTTYNGPEEILLYDFAVQVGDTLSYTDLGPAIVDSVYTMITQDGITRKAIEFSAWDFGPVGLYIEGIGGVGGLFNLPYFWGIFEGGSWLQCVLDLDQNIVYGDNYSCDEFITGIPKIDLKLPVNIYPNPCHDNLSFETSLTDLQVRVYDILGNELLFKKFVNGESIDLTSLTQGIYILKVFKENEEITCRRIIKM